MMNYESGIKNRSFTLVEVLVGTFLILIVFLGIFGAFRLGLKVVGLSKNKIIATAIANQAVEKIRNLPYQSVGVRGSFPDGVLESATTTRSNNVEYQIETRVDYVADPTDGIAAPGDECPNDYKKVEVKVSWQGLFGGQIKFSTDISPASLNEECVTGGGILSVSVFDAKGTMVSSPLIEIKNPATGQIIKSATPLGGQHYFSLATSTYKVVVSKPGYSSEMTYGTQEIATPAKPNPIVLDDQLTEISFSIDKTSTFSIDTLSPVGTDNFSDAFLDETKISQKSNVVISLGKVTLATSSSGYLPSGYLFSVEISPTTLVKWDKLSFSDSEPTNTDLKYQIYFASSTQWSLVPNAVLSGNSTGFDASPVDLSNLSITTYSRLKIKGNLSSSSVSKTPTLYDWQVSWITNLPTPIPNVAFSLRGDKIIGTDNQEEPVYKFSTTTATNSQGHKDISNLEWDSYTFLVLPASGLDLIDTDPSPQPLGLAPDVTAQVNLYLDAVNSLLVTVQDNETLEPILAASVRLYNSGLGYDVTQTTNVKGQANFMPLQVATYNLQAQGPGYSATSTTLYISGDITKIIRINQIE